MATLRIFLRFEIGFLLGSLALIVTYQMLTGRINTRGMLFDKWSKSFSPGRVQLLMLTFLGALYYILQVANNSKQLPEVPQELLLLLGGSHVVYLGGKGFPLLSSLFR